MNKILRYSFVVLMAMVFAPSFAEDIIWQEDFSSYAKDAVPAGGDYSYACENGGGTTKIYNANLAGGTAPELLVAKSQGSFSATIPLNGKSGEMNLTFLTNRNDLKVEITSATLGDKVRTGNADTYPVTVASGTASITIKFYMSSGSNARLDNIKFYQGTAKKPAGISWGKASTSVTFGEDYSSIPTLQNPNELSVVCTSDNEEACTVTNAGVITVVGAGDANISAAFEGNDEYEAQTVTIKITVKAAIDPDAKGQKNNPYLITDEEFQALAGSLKPEDESSTASSNPKSDKLYVKGYVVDIEEVTAENLEQYGNMTFKIAATKGDYNADIKLKAYRCKYLENAKFTSADQIKLDDEVVITGQIQWYGGSPQFVSGCNIYSIVTAAAETKYTITITNTDHGSVTLDKTEAAEGEKVNVLGWTNDEHFEMEPPTITRDDNGAAVEIQGTDGGYYIIMPPSNITIALNFIQEYKITATNDEHVSFHLDNVDLQNDPYKKAGKTVMLTIDRIDPGYYTTTVTVTAADNTAVTVQKNSETSYQFEMPAQEVTINVIADTWTVAGPVTGNGWDINASNDMTQTDGAIFTYVKEGITLEKGTAYEFKVGKNHAWTVCYPNANYKFTVDETGVYTVTITFNADTKEINHNAEKTGEAGPVTHTYSIVGDLVGGWEKDVDMTKGDDGLYKAVIENVNLGTYKFKVRVDHNWDVSYPDKDVTVNVDQNGSTVTVTFNEDNKEVKATVSTATDISIAKVVDLRNGQRYNVAGQMVTSSYKGLVIVNGKKMIQK